MSLPHVFRITKHDPADRDQWGRYVGTEDVASDHGPVEAAYLAAMTAFAEDTGVTRPAIRVTCLTADDEDFPELPARLTVLPDADGVLRARCAA
jgi:small subunit ribosomal protein S1